MPESRKILVTGAGGFIGGRVVEVLHQLGAGEILAGMRRWATGARVGRLPVDLVRCDIRDADQVRDALDGVSHIVHCAVGEHSSTVEGTRTLLQGAKEAGVRRIVHLSTVDVYGAPSGEIDESFPLTSMGKEYGDAKIEAEGVCQEFARDGVPITILRPTLVHGPFSATWTVAYAQRLQKRPWLVAETDAQGTCNLVYVDDLVGAILAAFDADTPPGAAYNINGPERPSWHEYFTALNAAMGLPPLKVSTPTGARTKAAMVQPFRKTAKVLITHFQPQIMGMAQRSQALRGLMVKAEGLIRTTPAPTEFAVYGRKASYRTTKAEEELGYVPRFPLTEALPLTAAWLRHHGYVTANA
ncbi:MAG: NAD-dependent epimerase/dehydratase family protein [Gemmatimonadota bacterium]|jgi:nucleoside-diphosphate-sugar epimerase